MNETLHAIWQIFWYVSYKYLMEGITMLSKVINRDGLEYSSSDNETNYICIQCRSKQTHIPQDSLELFDFHWI